MIKSKIRKYLCAVESLDFLLKDIMAQIKHIEQDQKDAPYIKLIELFYKGVDLREKISGYEKSSSEEPGVNLISGIDEDSV